MVGAVAAAMEFPRQRFSCQFDPLLPDRWFYIPLAWGRPPALQGYSRR